MSTSSSTTKPAIDNVSNWTTSCSSEATQRREHRNNWIAFILIIVFSLVALFVALLMIFLSQKGEIITHLEAKIYNVRFHRSMKNRTSKEFRNVSWQFCSEINKYFQSSQLSKMYRDCVVDKLRRGEKGNTTVEFRILFKKSESFIHPNKVRDVILNKAGRHKQNNDYYLCIGRFLILYRSLRLFLVRTSSTVPDILFRFKENGLDPEPNSVENEFDDYADSDPFTTTDETSRSVTHETHRGTTKDERTNDVTARVISTTSIYDSISRPNKSTTNKEPANLDPTKRKRMKLSSNLTPNATKTAVGSSKGVNNGSSPDESIFNLGTPNGSVGSSRGVNNGSSSDKAIFNLGTPNGSVGSSRGVNNGSSSDRSVFNLGTSNGSVGSSRGVNNGSNSDKSIFNLGTPNDSVGSSRGVNNGSNSDKSIFNLGTPNDSVGSSRGVNNGSSSDKSIFNLGTPNDSVGSSRGVNNGSSSDRSIFNLGTPNGSVGSSRGVNNGSSSDKSIFNLGTPNGSVGSSRGVNNGSNSDKSIFNLGTPNDSVGSSRGVNNGSSSDKSIFNLGTPNGSVGSSRGVNNGSNSDKSIFNLGTPNDSIGSSRGVNNGSSSDKSISNFGTPNGSVGSSRGVNNGSSSDKSVFNLGTLNGSGGSSRGVNNCSSSDKPISSLSSSGKNGNASIAMKDDDNCEQSQKNDNLSPLNVGDGSTTNSQLETLTISRVRVNKAEIILAGTTVAYPPSPLSSQSPLMKKLTSVTNKRNMTIYNPRDSDKDVTKGVESKLRKSERILTDFAENVTSVFSENSGSLNETELISDDTRFDNETSGYDGSESVANSTERLCAETNRTDSEKDLTISNTESWEQHDGSANGELDRLRHSATLSRNGQQQINSSWFNISFSNANITRHREVNRSRIMADNSVDGGEESAGRINEIQSDGIDLINVDIQIDSLESVQFNFNDTYSGLNEKFILSSLNYTTIYKENISSSNSSSNEYLTSSRNYLGITERNKTGEYYNSSTNNKINNDSSSFNSLYNQNLRQYNDSQGNKTLGYDNSSNNKERNNDSSYFNNLYNQNLKQYNDSQGTKTVGYYNSSTNNKINNESLSFNSLYNQNLKQYNDSQGNKTLGYYNSSNNKETNNDSSSFNNLYNQNLKQYNDRQDNKTVGYYNSSTNNKINNESSYFINSLYNQRQYNNDRQDIKNLTNLKSGSSYTNEYGNETNSTLSAAVSLKHYKINNTSIKIDVSADGNEAHYDVEAHYVSHYATGTQSETNSSLSAAVSLKNYNTNNTSIKTDESIFSMKYNESMLTFEDIDDYNSPSSGVVVRRQFDHISNSSWNVDYFDKTQEPVLSAGLQNNISRRFEINNRDDNDTVYSFAETDNILLADLDVTDSFNDTIAMNEDEELYDKVSLHENNELNKTTFNSTSTATTKGYDATASVLEDLDDYVESTSSMKMSGRKGSEEIRFHNGTGMDSLPISMVSRNRSNQTIIRVLNSGYQNLRPDSQKTDDNEPSPYKDDTGLYNETLFGSVKSNIDNSTLPQVTGLSKITVFSNNSISYYCNISGTRQNLLEGVFLSTSSLYDRQNNQSASHRERPFPNQRPNRNSTIFTRIKSSISKKLHQNTTVVGDAQTEPPSISQFETNKTSNLWTNNTFSNNDNNLAFPSTEAPTLHNKSVSFLLEIKEKGNIDIVHDSSLKSNNHSDLIRTSVERNRTPASSTTTLKPIRDTTVTEKINQSNTNRTTTSGTTIPKMSSRLVEITKRKSRVNIKPARSGWLAIRVDHTSRYFRRERRRKSEARTPTTTTSSVYAIGLVIKEHGVTNASPKNNTQIESSTAALLKGTIPNRNISAGVAFLTSGKGASDVEAKNADVTHNPRFIWNSPTTEPRNKRLQELGVDLDAVSLYSRPVILVNNRTKSTQVAKNESNIVKTVFRKENSSINEEFYTNEDEERDSEEILLNTNSSNEINHRILTESSGDIFKTIQDPFTLVLSQNISSVKSNVQSNSVKGTPSIIDDTRNITEVSGEIFKNIREPLPAVFRQNTSLIESNIQSNSVHGTPSIIDDTRNITENNREIFENIQDPFSTVLRQNISGVESNVQLNSVRGTPSIIDDTRNITESNREIFKNIREPSTVEFIQNTSWVQSNVQLNSVQGTPSNIDDTKNINEGSVETFKNIREPLPAVVLQNTSLIESNIQSNSVHGTPSIIDDTINITGGSGDILENIREPLPAVFRQNSSLIESNIQLDSVLGTPSIIDDTINITGGSGDILENIREPLPAVFRQNASLIESNIQLHSVRGTPSIIDDTRNKTELSREIFNNIRNPFTTVLHQNISSIENNVQSNSVLGQNIPRDENSHQSNSVHGTQSIIDNTRNIVDGNEEMLKNIQDTFSAVFRQNTSVSGTTLNTDNTRNITGRSEETLTNIREPFLMEFRQNVSSVQSNVQLNSVRGTPSNIDATRNITEDRMEILKDLKEPFPAVFNQKVSSVEGRDQLNSVHGTPSKIDDTRNITEDNGEMLRNTRKPFTADFHQNISFLERNIQLNPIHGTPSIIDDTINITSGSGDILENVTGSSWGILKNIRGHFPTIFRQNTSWVESNIQSNSVHGTPSIIDDTRNITGGSGDILENIREPFPAVFHQNISWGENNVQLNSVEDTSSNMDNSRNITEGSGEVFKNIQDPFPAVFSQNVSLTKSNVQNNYVHDTPSIINDTIIITGGSRGIIKNIRERIPAIFYPNASSIESSDLLISVHGTPSIIDDTRNMTGSSRGIIKNIRERIPAIFHPNASSIESSDLLISVHGTPSIIDDTSTDASFDINNPLLMDGSADFVLRDTLNSFGGGGDQLIYNNVNSTDDYKTTIFLDSGVSSTHFPSLATPITTPLENMTPTEIGHTDDFVETQRTAKLTIFSAIRPTRRFEKGTQFRHSLSSTKSPVMSPADISLENTVSASPKDARNLTNIFLNDLIKDKKNNRQNNRSNNIQVSSDIISDTEEPLFEVYNLTSDNIDGITNRQSRTETWTSIANKQQTSLTEVSTNSRNVTTNNSIDNRLSNYTTAFKNLISNINGSASMLRVYGKSKTNSRTKFADSVLTKTGHETSTAVPVRKTLSPLLRLFVLEGTSLQLNSSLKEQTLSETGLNHSSGISSNLSALASPKKLSGNGTKDSIGVTVIINIKSAGSGWVKIPINKTSSLKGVEIGVHRTSTTSTASKPFTNISIASTFLEPSLTPETTLISTNIAHLQAIIPAFNIQPVSSENADFIKGTLMPTPASQTALNNISFTAAKGLHLTKSYFQTAITAPLNAPTSVTGTKQNGVDTEEVNSTKRDFITSSVGTESVSEMQTTWPENESTTTISIPRSDTGLSADIQDLSQAVTIGRVTSGYTKTQATKTTPMTSTSTSTLTTYPMTTSPSITTTLPTSTTISSLTLATTLPPTTTLLTTLPLTTIPKISTATTLTTTTMSPTTTTLATASPSVAATLPPSTLATTLPLITTPQSPTILATTTLPLATTLLPLTTTLATTREPLTKSFRTPTTNLPLRTMTTNTKLTTIPSLDTTLTPLSPPTTKATMLSFAATLPLTTKATTSPTTTTTQQTNPVLTTTLPQPPNTSTLPPTTITFTTPTTIIPRTTFPQTNIFGTQPLTTQISTSSPTSTSITAQPATTSTKMPLQTTIPLTSATIQRLPVNTILSSTIITAQPPSSTVTFAPATSTSSADPTSTTPAPTTPTTNPTTTEPTVLNLTSVSGALYEPASVICTLIGPKVWTQIDISLDQSTTNRSKVLATFKRASLSSKTEDDSHSASLSIRGQVSRAKLIIERFQCDDQGLYTCMVDNGQLKDKRNVYAKILTPDLPKIEVNDFVERQTTRVSCRGIVPFPNGNLDWKLNGQIIHEEANMKVDTTSVGNCTKLLSKTFMGRFGSRLNGSELTCFESGSPQRFTSIKIQIVPRNFCQGRPINKVYSHPYTCNKYITCLNGYFLTSHCPDDLCYNAETNRCEELNEPTDPPFVAEKNQFSCIGKPTGQAVPNPDECTGYYLCVDGLKNIRRCPSNTFFTLTIPGFCTFDYNQSYCASIGTVQTNN